jgi:hypothetical protein
MYAGQRGRGAQARGRIARAEGLGTLAAAHWDLLVQNMTSGPISGSGLQNFKGGDLFSNFSSWRRCWRLQFGNYMTDGIITVFQYINYKLYVLNIFFLREVCLQQQSSVSPHVIILSTVKLYVSGKEHRVVLKGKAKCRLRRRSPDENKSC